MKGGTNITRKHREWYPGEILHVMNRGVNHQAIFQDEFDYECFLTIVKDTQKKYDFGIHAYCLMTNHYHVLIETRNDEIWKIIKPIDSIYARFYNTRHGRDGALFRGRYKSCEVKDDAYFLQSSRYICLNPVNAKIVPQPEQYRWSSYRTLIGMNDDRVTEREKTLRYFRDSNPTLYRDFVTSGVRYRKFEDSISKEMGDDEWLPW